jgi:protein TonB
MRRITDRRWLVAMSVLSCMVHLSLFAAAGHVASNWSSDRVERSSVRIALGSTGAAAGQLEQPQVIEASEPVPEEPTEQQPDEQVSEQPDMPEPPVPVEPTPEPAPVPEPTESTTEPPPEPKPRVVQDMIGNLGVAGERAPSEQVDTDGETQQEGFNAPYDFDGAVLAHLSSFRRFPMHARMRREEGAVTVSFTIDRNGRVLRSRIVDGSGSRLLDRAALKQIERAEPFPTPPDDARWTERDYRTTIRFELR